MPRSEQSLSGAGAEVQVAVEQEARFNARKTRGRRLLCGFLLVVCRQYPLNLRDLKGFRMSGLLRSVWCLKVSKAFRVSGS